jgi:hypothetical protein
MSLLKLFDYETICLRDLVCTTNEFSNLVFNMNGRFDLARCLNNVFKKLSSQPSMNTWKQSSA